MQTLSTVAEIQAERDRKTGSVGLVPTMGYLHEGHMSLVRRARIDNDHVIVSIFVNPTQFGPSEDFERYPRDEERDLGLLEHEGVHVAFVPSVEEMYPPGFDGWIEVRGPLTERLEAEYRPGYFRGVTTIVARLFRILRPQRAYFGQKDAQQLRVIRRMVQDQRLPVEIVPMHTVREPDGLALSSRNVYLSPDGRRAALVLPRALALARRLVMDEGISEAETVRRAVRDSIATRVDAPRRGAPALHLDLDYVSISDEQTLDELETVDRPALVLLAARVGLTRLIDNALVVPKGAHIPDDLLPLVQSDAASLPSPA